MQNLDNGIWVDDKGEKIYTKDVCPPIPVRGFDWQAVREWDEFALCGEGETEQEAIDNLLRLEEDQD